MNDLVSRMRTEEIIKCIKWQKEVEANMGAPAITRLGIGPCQWETECWSGDVMAGNATSFPIAIFKIVMRHSHLIHDEVIYGIITG